MLIILFFKWLDPIFIDFEDEISFLNFVKTIINKSQKNMEDFYYPLLNLIPEQTIISFISAYDLVSSYFSKCQFKKTESHQVSPNVSNQNSSDENEDSNHDSHKKEIQPRIAEENKETNLIIKNSVIKINQLYFTDSTGFSPNQRQGLRNLGNTCYSNALFQCLFDVEKFRNAIIQEMSQENQVPKPLTSIRLLSVYLTEKGQLGYFFKNLQERSIDTQESYKNLLEILFDKRKEFQIGVQGDSSVLFRALLEELADEGTYLKIFQGGNLAKNKQCLKCKEKKQIVESLLILEVRDLCFNIKDQERFFQPKKEIGTCKKCHKKEDFICTYQVTEFPEILVIKIHDTINFNKIVQILPKTSFKAVSDKEAVRYEFVASVMNEERGKDGFHSVELIYYEGDYSIIDDDKKLEKVHRRLEDLGLHPRLLFYKKI